MAGEKDGVRGLISIERFQLNILPKFHKRSHTKVHFQFSKERGGCLEKAQCDCRVRFDTKNDRRF
jgi:hypothetical protein